MGRIVRYRPPLDTWGAQPVDCQAMVQRVLEDGSLVLWVFGPYDLYLVHRVFEGVGPGEWSEL